MTWLKKLLVEYALKKGAINYIKRFDGYKAYTGVLLLLFGMLLRIRHDDAQLREVLLTAISVLRQVGESPLNDAEVIMLTGQITVVVGLLHKAYKKLITALRDK